MKELVAWETLPQGVRLVTRYAHGPDLVECAHAEEHRVTTIREVAMCRVCKGDEFTTSEFTRPVKMLVRLPAGARALVAAEQVSLF